MSLTCEDVRESYSALLDQEVDLEYREVLELHLSGCSDCLRSLAKFKAVTDIYKDLPAPDGGHDFEALVCARLDAPEGPGAASPRRHYPWLAAAAAMVMTGLMAAAWYLFQ